MPTQFVIIGAGPAGLYAAINLKLKLKDEDVEVRVFDPRDKYIRHGNLNTMAFTHAEKKFNFRFSFPVKENNEVREEFLAERKITGKSHHIKEFERGLYNYALSLGIKIEKKEFLRVAQEPNNPGVILLNTNTNEEEFYKAHYVFDCTGNKRLVMKSVNALMPQAPPFTFETMTTDHIKSHFTAYVSISDEQASDIKQALSTPIDSTSVTFFQSIAKLRALGWQEWTFPFCIDFKFCKNKVCFYTSAPDNLTPENYDQWLKTVLEAYTNKPIEFRQLPNPKNKPRIGLFRMNATVTHYQHYSKNDLPIVIPFGDTEIDPHYQYGLGISKALQRIDFFMDSFWMLGEECMFEPDLESVVRSLNNEITSQENSFKMQTTKIKNAHMEAATKAIDYVKKIMDEVLDENERQLLKKMEDECGNYLKINNM